MNLGYDGFIHAEAMDGELLHYFCDNYLAEAIPLYNRPFHFIMDMDAAYNIRKEYEYEWSDEEY